MVLLVTREISVKSGILRITAGESTIRSEQLIDEIGRSFKRMIVKLCLSLNGVRNLLRLFRLSVLSHS